MADENKFSYLDEEGAVQLVGQIFTEVNERIKNRIVSEVKENDDTHVPSAAAVYRAIANKSKYRFTPYTGTITDIDNPLSDTIYLQRDSELDKSWTMYVYDESIGWINIGDTNIDLSDYWSKSDEDVAELKSRLGIDDKISNSQMIKIDKESLYKLIADIDSKIKPDAPVYTLTIEYIGPNGKMIASPIIDSYYDGETYFVPSPNIPGYTPDIDIAKGVIDSNISITVTYSILSNTMN